MSLRAVAWAWAVAVILAAGLTLALADRTANAPPTFNGAQIAVIGSSLTRHAFPKQGGAGQGSAPAGLLGDGRSHYRIGLPAVSEPEVLALIDRAVAERAELVLLEAWPLVYDVQQVHAARRCDQPARRVRVWLKQRQQAWTDAVAHWTGRVVSTDDGGDPPDLDNRDPQAFAASVRAYGLVLREPCDMDKLARAVRAARAAGTRIMLVAPPRSLTADRLLGAEQVAAVDKAAQGLARQLEVPLFAPSGPWPDNRFVSIGHFNRAGRAQMHAELRAWIGRQP